MATISRESIFKQSEIKPSSFIVWCLLCEVFNPAFDDVFLSLECAEQAGIKKSAYYAAFTELEKENWIEFSKTKDGRKHWKLVKGFSANVETDSANVENIDENSANVEKSADIIPQTWNPNSANVEIPPHPPIRITDFNKTKTFKSKTGVSQKPKLTEFANSQANEIFLFWQETFEKKRAKFSEAKNRMLKARLEKDKFSIEDLKNACLGNKSSPWHQGDNPNRIKYNDFDDIFLTAERVEKNIGRYEASLELIKDGSKQNGTNYNGSKQNNRTTEETLRAIGSVPANF